MKKTLKGIYLLISSLFITILHLPFALAKPVLGNRLIPGPAVSVSSSPGDSVQRTGTLKSVYDSLHLELSGLSR